MCIRDRVSDVRMPGDSIRSTITVNLPSSLPSGNYKLRVMAIEGWVIYSTPPGSNGETHFEHVFRRAYPNTAGTTFSGTAGTHQYVFTYKRDPVWNDTSIYTVAFIQNDNNKEVLNSARGKYFPLGISGNNMIAHGFSLHQNYPNPFNPVTVISFTVPERSFITLRVYDITGREIALLANGWFQQGRYDIEWDASGYSSGIYFYSLISEKFSQTKKMILSK
ncbi:MAG: T9SS type A sorting domain-containing protein, partial [Ignavibacteria bacterium]|nr:T9SS type A sorting domain-containing protein [Ignavibacteria bacterium]